VFVVECTVSSSLVVRALIARRSDVPPATPNRVSSATLAGSRLRSITLLVKLST